MVIGRTLSLDSGNESTGVGVYGRLVYSQCEFKFEAQHPGEHGALPLASMGEIFAVSVTDRRLEDR